ncbi:alpha/beta fold hydrolase BchO [Lamprocystis purpurea]|jgi:magnesium chelatase accessory protein|uniref:alpha/beta fold hydrolase BchO n=1 Tax=Lamprocystis purpurea TaxID=61598 RepID=UPI00035F9DF9|nr:alpha/beta fold hydrolase BchO [Lamprocystis purpurea]
MHRRLDWDHEGRDWPNRDASRFVSAGGLRWHVQQLGQGPVLVLVHGTGAATHSWRTLAPLLAQDFQVVAADLPGHGFTQTPGDGGLSLPGMATSLAALLDTLGVTPDLVLGHSAGAAVLVRLCLDQRIAPDALISLNGALLPLRGLAGQWFAPAARFFATHPLASRYFAWRARAPGAVKRLVASTGSRLDAQGMEFYRRLVINPGHVAAAIGMMANWDLQPLARDLPRLATPLVMLVAEGDSTVSPAEARRVRTLLPTVEVQSIPRLGHLAHEEAPQTVASLIRSIAQHYRK